MSQPQFNFSDNKQDNEPRQQTTNERYNQVSFSQSGIPFMVQQQRQGQQQYNVVNQEEFSYDPQAHTFMQQTQPVNGNFVTAQVMNYPRVNPCNPCQASPLHMAVQVVTKEEIEAPWRLECEYLQSVITQLESRRTETKVIEKVVEKEKLVKDTEAINQLEAQLRQLKLENQQTIFDLKGQLSDQENMNRNLKSQLSQRDQEFQSFQSSGMSAQSKYDQLYEEYNKLKNQFKSKDAEIDRLNGVMHEYMDQMNRLQNQISGYESDLRMRDQELQSKMKLIGQLQTSVSDSSRYKDYELRCQSLEGELANVKSLLSTRTQECESLRIRIGNYEKDNAGQLNQYRYQISDLENQVMQLNMEIEKLKSALRGKQEEIDEYLLRIQQLEEQGTTVVQERVTYLSQEVEVWKQKFIKLNHEYNNCQEALIMAQAELEALQKQQKKEVVVERSTRVVNQSSTQRSQVGGGGASGVVTSTTQRRQYEY